MVVPEVQSDCLVEADLPRYRPRLTAVPDDVAQHVLAHLNAYDVTRLALTSSIFRRHVRLFRPKILEVVPRRVFGPTVFTTDGSVVEGRRHAMEVQRGLDYALKDNTVIDMDSLHVRDEDFWTPVRLTPQAQCNVLWYPEPMATRLLQYLYSPRVGLRVGPGAPLLPTVSSKVMKLLEQWAFVCWHNLTLTGIHIHPFQTTHCPDPDDPEDVVDWDDPDTYLYERLAWEEVSELPLGDAQTTALAPGGDCGV